MSEPAHHDAHTAGTLALVDVAKAALAGLRIAVEDLAQDPKSAHRAVSEQATLLSKAVDSLSKRIDHLPDTPKVAPEADIAATDGLLANVTDALGRLRRVADGHTCTECGLVLPEAANAA